MQNYSPYARESSYTEEKIVLLQRWTIAGCRISGIPAYLQAFL